MWKIGTSVGSLFQMLNEIIKSGVEMISRREHFGAGALELFLEPLILLDQFRVGVGSRLEYIQMFSVLVLYLEHVPAL